MYIIVVQWEKIKKKTKEQKKKIAIELKLHFPNIRFSCFQFSRSIKPLTCLNFLQIPCEGHKSQKGTNREWFM